MASEEKKKGTMKQPPEIIWLRPDLEDPGSFIWEKEQPVGGDSARYVRFDAINKHHPRQVFKEERIKTPDRQCCLSGKCAVQTHGCETKECYVP